MVKKKKQGLDKHSNINDNLSSFDLQNGDNSNTDSVQCLSYEDDLNDEDSDCSIMISNSIRTASNYSRKKRSLPRSTSTVTKKTRSS